MLLPCLFLNVLITEIIPIPKTVQGFSLNHFHPLQFHPSLISLEKEIKNKPTAIKLPCRCHGEYMAKRNHHTFYLRSDAMFLQQSPFSSLQLLWCFIAPCYFFCYLMLVQNPSGGTNPWHSESTLCTPSFTGLFCLFLLVQSSQKNLSLPHCNQIICL